MYFVMEHQVKNAPNPTKASIMPVLKFSANIINSEPKMEHRLPSNATMYHALNSFVFSQKVNLLHDKLCFL